MTSNSKRTIGTRLKEARVRRDLSQEQVAKMIGVHPVTISKYERDTQDPNTTVLSKMASIYDVTIDWLVLENDSQENRPAGMNREKMKEAISYPSILVYTTDQALSKEAIEDLEEYIGFLRQRDKRRRDYPG